jgi:DNA replication protein DnaC
MGYDPINREEASLFFRLASHRYGRGAMIITTNKTVRDWPKLLAGDEVLRRRSSTACCIARMS